MADVSNVDTSLSVERTAPTGPSAANKPQRVPEPSSGGRDGAAFSVDISSEAQRLSANDNAAPQTPVRDASESESNRGSQSSANFDTTFETSAPGGIEGASSDGSRTNQVASFENEHTGNDSRNTSEASRTLGQVVDTFA